MPQRPKVDPVAHEVQSDQAGAIGEPRFPVGRAGREQQRRCPEGARRQHHEAPAPGQAVPRALTDDALHPGSIGLEGESLEAAQQERAVPRDRGSQRDPVRVVLAGAGAQIALTARAALHGLAREMPTIRMEAAGSEALEED
jgi:hypothetical protein